MFETDLTASKAFYFIIFKDFIHLFLERRREGDIEGKKHQCVVASRAPPTGDLAWNPGMCPRLGTNWQPFGSQAALNPLSYTSQGPKPLKKKKILFIFWREWKGGRQGEKHWSAAFLTPSWGPGPQPRHVPWPEIKLWPFSWRASVQPTEPHQPGSLFFFLPQPCPPQSPFLNHL